MPKTLAVLLLLALLPTAHAQQMYRWVDRNGVTHFSATLPSAAEQRQAGEIEERAMVSAPRVGTESPGSIGAQLRIVQDMNARDRAERAAAMPVPVASEPRRKLRLYQYGPYIRER